MKKVWSILRDGGRLFVGLVPVGYAGAGAKDDACTGATAHLDSAWN
jgi:hypothetical protein